MADRFVAETLDATLEELERDVWPSPKDAPPLVEDLHRLRKVPLRELRAEDLRLAFSQGVGLRFLMPLAMGMLEREPFAHGDFYPGDLLVAVARVEAAFWRGEPELRARFARVLEAARARLKEINAPAGVERALEAAARNLRSP